MKIQDVFVPIKSEFTPCIICCRLCYCQEYLWTSYCNRFCNDLKIRFRGKKGKDTPTIFKRGVWTQHKITYNYINRKIIDARKQIWYSTYSKIDNKATEISQYPPLYKKVLSIEFVNSHNSSISGKNNWAKHNRLSLEPN